MAQSLLRIPTVIQRTGYSRASLYALIAKGEFPRPISLGARAVAWPSDEIDQWIAGRIERSRKVVA
jgi:prophage regulatory protein